MLSEYGAGNDLPGAIRRITLMPLAIVFVLHRAACVRHGIEVAGPSYVAQDMVAAFRANEK